MSAFPGSAVISILELTLPAEVAPSEVDGTCPSGDVDDVGDEGDDGEVDGDAGEDGNDDGGGGAATLKETEILTD